MFALRRSLQGADAGLSQKLNDMPADGLGEQRGNRVSDLPGAHRTVEHVTVREGHQTRRLAIGKAAVFQRMNEGAGRDIAEMACDGVRGLIPRYPEVE